MLEHDNRRIEREALMMLADLRLTGEEGEHRVRIRNLSAKGMMAEGAVRTAPGALVEVALEDHGWVAGAVAWVQDNRFGIAFREDIDSSIFQRGGPGSVSACPTTAEPSDRSSNQGGV